MTYPYGRVIETQYDGVGRVARVTIPDGRKYRLRYNSYDEAARTEIPTGAAIEYDYDFAGNLTSETYPSGYVAETQVYTYDALNRLKSARESYVEADLCVRLLRQPHTQRHADDAVLGRRRGQRIFLR